MNQRESMDETKRIKNSSWIVLILLVAAIKVVSVFPAFVEKYYALGLYPVIAKFQRILLGWVPFSIGDILYIAVIVISIRAIVLFIKRWHRRQLNRSAWLNAAKKLLFVGMTVYVIFNLSWGLNYNRLPASEQFGLQSDQDAYTVPALGKLVSLLKDSLNALDASGTVKGRVLSERKLIFREAAGSYRSIGLGWPGSDAMASQLFYPFKSVKPSLFGYICNYSGISGYYNPFTGEAQVNTTIPDFLQPFVSCHEIGHQLGYGKEDEANFVGFIAASKSQDASFRYSAYFDMYTYARRALYRKDSLLARSIHETLNLGVKKDLAAVREFYAYYEGVPDRVISFIYGQYLKANQQPEGLQSYSEVVAMLIAYYTRLGLIGN